MSESSSTNQATLAVAKPHAVVASDPNQHATTPVAAPYDAIRPESKDDPVALTTAPHLPFGPDSKEPLGTSATLPPIKPAISSHLGGRAESRTDEATRCRTVTFASGTKETEGAPKPQSRRAKQRVRISRVNVYTMCPRSLFDSLDLNLRHTNTSRRARLYSSKC